MTSADHAFEAFIAGLGADSFVGTEQRMYAFYRRHPAQVYRAEIEAEITAYNNRKRK